jgi:hypothetical protein
MPVRRSPTPHQGDRKKQNPTPHQEKRKKKLERIREPSIPRNIPSVEATDPVVLPAPSSSAAGVTASAAHPTSSSAAGGSAPPACPGSASLISAVSHAFRCRLATAGQTGQIVATVGQLRARQLPIVEVMVLPPQPSANSSKPLPHSPSRLLSVQNRARPAAAAGIPPSAEPVRRRRQWPRRRTVHLAYRTSKTGEDCRRRYTDAAGSGNAAAPSMLLLPH